MKILFIIGVLIALSRHVKGANILGLFAYSSQSHFNAIQPLLVGLSKKHHNVTSVGSFRLGEKLDNYVEMYVPPFDFWLKVQKELGIQNMFQTVSVPSKRIHNALRNSGVALVDNFLSHPKVKELLHPTTIQQYDVIIVDLFYTEGLLMVGRLYDKPIVAISSSNFEHYMTDLVDYSIPSACLPISFQNYVENPSFFERISNIFECLQRRNQRKEDLLAQQEIAKTHFEKLQTAHYFMANLQEQISILLINNYSPILIPSPILSNIIPVGGLHIKPTQNIQWNIKRFLDDARDGAIYFSLGTALKCSDLPKEKLNLFMSAFAKLKERILWHCDLEKIENLPKNILLQNIISSSDILAHPHLKFFVTSGGLLSLQEAIYRNVPVLGIPVFHDQIQNVRRIEDLRVGIRLDFSNLTESSLSWALQTLTTDISYLTNVREVSSRYRDRPLGAVQTSMFWIEHVVRHRNTSHLRTLGADPAWPRQYLIDLFMLLVMSIMIVLVIGVVLYKTGEVIYRKREQNKLYTKLQ